MRIGRIQKGSALVMVIWTIAVLSILVMSFAVEAKLQTAANVYMRERVHLDHLIDAGRVLGEMIILTHQEKGQQITKDTDWEELLEDNRWVREQSDLKRDGARVVIGPIAPDEEHPEGGNVTIEIESVGGGENGGGSKFNINTLHEKGDPHYKEIWENILYWVGVPEDDHDYFLNSWLDWRDEDDVRVGVYSKDDRDSGEQEWYEDLCENNEQGEKEEKYKPRNGPIKDLKELARVGAFRLHPAVLVGGWYYDEKKVKPEDNIWITNTLEKVFTTFGGRKINVNHAERDVLINIPGIRNTDEPDEFEDDETMNDVIRAILEWRRGVDMDGREVDLDDEESGTLIPDWSKLNEITQGYIKPAAQEYLAYTGGNGDGALYNLTITASSVGMTHVVKAKMVIRESRPVYLEWMENP